ncbi:MAG: serine/threonine protein kinase [Candidatus Obscuribacterales bacterium]|nr:serine/threonine protein kinase [Candidatus Obscuribacterales bacterium]
MTPSEGFDDNSEHLLIPSEQDFVVSKWVLSEKQRALGLRSRAPIRLAFAALTLGLTVIGFISITSCALEYSFNSVFAVFAALSILFSMAWFFWELRLHGTAYDFPTNLVSLANGLKLSWRFQTSRDSQLFLWSGFQSVHFLSKDDLISENAIVSVSSRSLNSTPANFSGPCGYGDSYTELLRGGNLRLRYDLTGFNLKNRINLVNDLKGLSTGKNLHIINLLRSSFVEFDVPLDSFTLESDKERFIATLDVLLPEQCKDTSFQTIVARNGVASYTKFWLDNMNSLKRSREEELPTGTLLNQGEYEIVGRVATGGQAKIYEASSRTGPVILKEFVLPVNAGMEVRQRSFAAVKREAELLSALDHPMIVKLLSNFVEDHRAYLVLEMVKGESLKRHVERTGPLSSDSIISIASEVLTLLSYLHGLSPPLVHRDISPDNLMYYGDKDIKLIDFNVAREMESGATRTVVGKHNYMAPEQFKGRANPQSDLYSLGATLYFLKTAKEPLALCQSKLPAYCLNEPKDFSLDLLIRALTELDLEKRAPDSAGALQIIQEV